MESLALDVFRRRLDRALVDVVRGYRGSAGLAVGLDDLTSLFQPQRFWDFY